MVLIIVITIENFTLKNILICYLPKHPVICFLHVSASLFGNELNKEGTVEPGHAAISKQTNSNSGTG
jgi:hypothetical protein